MMKVFLCASKRFSPINAVETNLNLDNKMSNFVYVRNPIRHRHLGKKLMVLKAWPLSCNYELKSSSTGPHFFLIYLDVKIILHPKSIPPTFNLDSYPCKSKVEISLSTHLITFNVIFSYETFVCMHLFIRDRKLTFTRSRKTEGFSYNVIGFYIYCFSF